LILGVLNGRTLQLDALDALLVGLIYGQPFGLAAGFAAGLAAPSDLDRTTIPEDLLRRDRTTALVTSSVVAVAVGFSFSNFTDVGLQTALMSQTWTWQLVALTFGLPVAIGVGLSLILASAWGRWQFARAWLAMTGRLPWRTMKFLQDAHRRGMLRQAGGVYQFRHARLQDRFSPTNYRKSVVS
jgi:hypothetical protein